MLPAGILAAEGRGNGIFGLDTGIDDLLWNGKLLAQKTKMATPTVLAAIAMNFFLLIFRMPEAAAVVVSGFFSPLSISGSEALRGSILLATVVPLSNK